MATKKGTMIDYSYTDFNIRLRITFYRVFRFWCYYFYYIRNKYLEIGYIHIFRKKLFEKKY